MWPFLYKLASPQSFYQLSGQLLPWVGGISLILFILGMVTGLLFAPADYQQGDAFRIIYVHVPSAIMSMGVYVFMAIAAIISLVWKIKLADVVVKVSAPIGAWFTFLALITGSFWGKPMWGTWWVWDARLTSELILLFLYFGVMALQAAIPERQQAAKAGAIMVLVGVINIPIIHYSVYWWNTLHQGATISRLGKPTMAFGMLYPLLLMLLAFAAYYLLVLLLQARCELLERERNSHWVRQLCKL
ncbi:heme ABC transporter permease [soil metagenome]